MFTYDFLFIFRGGGRPLKDIPTFQLQPDSSPESKRQDLPEPGAPHRQAQRLECAALAHGELPPAGVRAVSRARAERRVRAVRPTCDGAPGSPRRQL